MDECNAYKAAEAELSEITALLAAEDMDWERWEEAKEEMSNVHSDIEESREEIRTTVVTDELNKLNEALSALLATEDALRQELAEFDCIRKDYESQDDVATAISEYPLSIEVSSGWTLLSEELVPEKFCILLQTGGPAVRIIGDLDEYREPDRAWLEYQDWGTPWKTFVSSSNAPLYFVRKFLFA